MLSNRLNLLFLLFICLTLSSLAQLSARQPEQPSYNQHIRPILADFCFPCHGPDESHRQADLRLDLRQSALDQGAIAPGNPSDSSLCDRILHSDPTLIMPPPSTRKKLSAEQIATLQLWVEQGARYQEHWAFVPPAKTSIPANKNPIDFLLEQYWKETGIQPALSAEPRVLVRRLYSDLIGLPPDPEEVEAYSKDASTDRYHRIVEQLLASPHFGERMAIVWLDQVRFADTIGYHSDNPRNIWPYRDWVIRAFNQNLPYDQFTIQQIAGDLVPSADTNSRVASAFNRLVQSTEEGGAQPKDYESRMMADRVRAVGSVWLGLTTGCAQCHDHKFDPFTIHDFYAMGAFFADIDEKPIGEREPGMLVIQDEAQKRLAELDRALEQAQATLRANAKEPTESMMAEVERARQARKTFYNTLPKCLVSQSLKEPRLVRVLARGNWQDESGPIVRPSFPAFLSPSPSEPRLSRLDLANWIVSRDNPLTARVQVNRIWRQLFGEGLCRTINDFGLQGDLPVHQSLLDWLAVDFMEHHWDTKYLIRLIVSSQAYQQSSHAQSSSLDQDPSNRAVARQGRYRLEAELIRDQALAASKLLDRTIGGPSIKPYQPDDYWENLNFPVRKYVPDQGPQQHRRGLYIWWQRTFLHPALLAMDAPSREECTAERNRSNIPQQALVLLNDPCYLECHRAFAYRMMTEPQSKEPSIDPTSNDTKRRIRWAFQHLLQREPDAAELQILEQTYATHLTTYQATPTNSLLWLNIGTEKFPSKVDLNELAAWSHIARILMNLHEAVTRF